MITSIAVLAMAASIIFSTFYLGKNIVSIFGKCEFTAIDNLKFWLAMIVLNLMIMVTAFLSNIPVDIVDWFFLLAAVCMFAWGLEDVNNGDSRSS